MGTSDGRGPGRRGADVRVRDVKVFLSADMEGVSGLVDAGDVQPGGVDYERGRILMTEDVNAAIRGVHAAAGPGAEITVNDAHGPMRNILPERLDPAARLIRGRPKLMGMLEGLDGSFDAMVCIGYHARAGTLGVLSHSFMGHEIEDMWLDERPTGEIGLAQATAAALGVPLAVLSGDDAACAEMTAWGGGAITVPVKYARDRFAAELLPVPEAQAAIEAAVGRGLAHLPAAEPVDREAVLAVRWQSASVAAQLAPIPGTRARDSRTVEVSGPLPDLYRLFGVFMRVATALTNQPPYC
jgi:D-amino peptidase